MAGRGTQQSETLVDQSSLKLLKERLQKTEQTVKAIQEAIMDDTLEQGTDASIPESIQEKQARRPVITNGFFVASRLFQKVPSSKPPKEPPKSKG